MSVNINAPNSLIIIAETAEKVNSFAPKNSDKWIEKKLNSGKIAGKLLGLGYEKRAERMSNCGNFLEYEFCSSCNSWHIKKANLCRDRFCPVCGWRLSLQRYGNMCKIFEKLMQDDESVENIHNWSLITLTVKNCKGEDIKETMSLMSKAWNLTLQQRSIKPHLEGWARSTEITYNHEKKTFHPHYHVLICWKNNVSDMMIKKWLFACKKYGLTADIKAQDASQINYFESSDGNEIRYAEIPEDFTKAVLETFKYSVKSKDMVDMPLGEFRNLVEQYGGKRLTAFGGIIKKIASELKVDNEEVQDDESNLQICRNCGSIDIQKLIYKWSYGERAYKLWINQQ